jgi:quercetin 2,3-dioxygenase
VRIVKSRVEPRYQETASDDIPVTDNMDGVSVKVIAAECLGVRSAVRPRTPAMCLDVARLRQPVPRGWSACAYVVAGEAVFEGAASAVGARTLVVFGGDGDGVNARAAEEATGATRG